MWVQRALTFLVISCPCALVISVPLTFFCAIGSASKKGILIKGSGYIEKLSKPFAVVFDKTGTITKGVFKFTQIIPDNGSNSDDVLKYAHRVMALKKGKLLAYTSPYQLFNDEKMMKELEIEIPPILKVAKEVKKKYPLLDLSKVKDIESFVQALKDVR